MYAIVKTGGKQYRVERGQRLLVERLSAVEGESVALQPILYRSEEAVFDKAGLAKVTVTARVLAHERGEKLRVFKFKPKRGYKRRTGHRQELTRIEVTELGLGDQQGSRAKAAPAPVAAKPASPEAGSAKPASPEAGPARPASAKPAAGSAKPARARAAPAKAAGAPKTTGAKTIAADTGAKDEETKTDGA
jgi:large subunit ribosomal protein L21